MKVEMSESGTLLISPESSCDAFALRMWIQQHPLLTCCCEREFGTGVLIDASWPPGEGILARGGAS
jgi:hypothetical protein